MAWGDWAAAVLNGIVAPVSHVNGDTLWAWSNAETAPYDLMRWNNPLNTTEPWPRARDSGAQPGLHDVKIYASLQDGIDATVYTLIGEPYYGAIVANLRAGLPRQQWGVFSVAGSELHAWGTGTNWLQSTYGPMPVDFKGDTMTPEQEAKLDNALADIKAIYFALGMPSTNLADPSQAKSPVLTGIRTAIAGIPASNGGILTPLQAQALIDIHDMLSRVEAALKTA